MNIMTHPCTQTWLQIAPIGTFSHPLGNEQITKTDMQVVVKNSRTLWQRLGLKKIPVYQGHPDDPNFNHLPEHMNPTIYGYVRKFQINDTGLWVQIRWIHDIDWQADYCLSPRWFMQKIGNNVYKPIRLISVGITRSPNLPVSTSQTTPSEPLTALRNLRKTYANDRLQEIQQRMKQRGESYPEAWHAIQNH